jgi:glycosyltransferase involved in cell wall biosynthesis
MKKISVIIPIYNGEKYITETIQSIISQTYPIFEIIVINDGSTDGSLQIIENISKEFSNVIILNQKNSGPAAARNNGIRNSSGEYIAFCDADDIWVPDKIEKQMKIFQNTDVRLVYSGMKSFGFTNDTFLYNGKNSARNLFKQNYIPNSSVVLHKSVIEKVGLLYESKSFFSIDEDYQYWLRIVHVFAFDLVPEPLLRYRIHDHQISKGSKKSYQRLVRVYIWFLMQWKYKKYWDICLIKIIHNSVQYVRFSIFDLWNIKKQ